MPTAWRAVVAVWALLAAAVVVALGIALHDRQGTTLDTSVADALHRHIGDGLSWALLGLSSPGISVGVLAMVFLGALLARSWPVAALALVGPLVALGVTEKLLKPLVHREIRFTLPDGVVTQGIAFPSGHETGLVSMLIVLALLLSRVRLRAPARVAWYVLLVLWSVIGAVGLVRADYHFLTDTIGGAAVAIACVCGTALVIDALATRWAGGSARDPLLHPPGGVLRV